MIMRGRAHGSYDYCHSSTNVTDMRPAGVAGDVACLCRDRDVSAGTGDRATAGKGSGTPRLSTAIQADSNRSWDMSDCPTLFITDRCANAGVMW